MSATAEFWSVSEKEICPLMYLTAYGVKTIIPDMASQLAYDDELSYLHRVS